jgi:RNA recognition motif-containing protein
MKLYVGNIPWKATEKDLLALFDDFAPSGARVLREDDGRSKGVGFVFIDDVAAAAAIAAMDGFQFGGRRLMVSIAKRQRMSIAEERKYGNNTW